MSIFNFVALATLAVGVAAPIGANAGTFSTLYAFTGGSDGGNAYGPLMYQGGKLYGTTPNTGFNYIGGNVFKVDAATGAFKVVYAFKGGSDGNNPDAGVIYHDGMLYGTTEVGGGSGCVVAGHTYGCGTIFSINLKTHAETVIYEFSQNPHASPAGPGELVNLAGTLYGSTSAEGANGYGSIFSFDLTTGTFSTLYSFAGSKDGASPNPQLLYENGLFYGTTLYGGGGPCRVGDGGCGTVFAVNPSTGTETVLHVFSSFIGGLYPFSNLIYQAGSLEGDTAQGGMKPPCRSGCGVSFAIDAATGAETILDTFKNRKALYSALTLTHGSVYETLGRAGGHGKLVRLDAKSGKQTVLYEFTGGADGDNPEAPLIYHDGALYGSTFSGGNLGCSGGAGCGTIFKYVP